MRIIFDISPALGRVIDRWCDSDNSYLERILREIKRLRELIVRSREARGIVFTQVRVGGNVIKGEIKEMKIEFGQRIRITATPVGGVGIQPGSAVWAAQAADADGNDRSSDYEVIPNPENELECDIQHSGTTESVGVATLRADGDRDTDETAEVVGSLALVADEPNVTAFDLAATVVDPPTPE